MEVLTLKTEASIHTQDICPLQLFPKIQPTRQSIKLYSLKSGFWATLHTIFSSDFIRYSNAGELKQYTRGDVSVTMEYDSDSKLVTANSMKYVSVFVNMVLSLPSLLYL